MSLVNFPEYSLSSVTTVAILFSSGNIMILVSFYKFSIPPFFPDTRFGRLRFSSVCHIFHLNSSTWALGIIKPVYLVRVMTYGIDLRNGNELAIFVQHCLLRVTQTTLVDNDNCFQRLIADCRISHHYLLIVISAFRVRWPF